MIETLRHYPAKRDGITRADREFGERLKKVIKDHGMTQKSFCDLTGFSLTMMYRWTTGEKIMRVKTFAKTVDALGLTAMEIAYLLEVFWMEEEDG